VLLAVEIFRGYYAFKERGPKVWWRSIFMRNHTMVVSAILFGMIMVAGRYSFGDEVEHDRCICKLVKGAESTLKGGTCVRTESSTSSACLMEWGGASTSPVSQGNGLGQQEASARAYEEFTRANDIRMEIPRLAPTSDLASPLEVAIANLTQVPPPGYGRPGMPESFLLAAGTALVRFSKEPLNFLAGSLLRDRRKEFIAAVQEKGEFKVEQFLVVGNTGCLQIEDLAQVIRVFVKTPFANSERC
jgi:hypothetical protein